MSHGRTDWSPAVLDLQHSYYFLLCNLWPSSEVEPYFNYHVNNKRNNILTLVTENLRLRFDC